MKLFVWAVDEEGVMKNKRKVYNWIVTVGILLFLFPNLFADDLIISWNSNDENDLLGYKVYWGISSRTYYDPVDVGNDTTYTLHDLFPGTQYFFSVTAYDTAWNESNYSEEVSYTIEIPDTTIPKVLSANLFEPTELKIIFSEPIQTAPASSPLHPIRKVLLKFQSVIFLTLLGIKLPKILKLNILMKQK